MKVGDFVKYKDLSGLNQFAEYRGVIIGQIPGTNNTQVVLWANNNLKQSHNAKNLEVIKENK
tara:strand:+ start:78 stop:263 length:186 start_codon:yes stop_codon:yes gene_type:complete